MLSYTNRFLHQFCVSAEKYNSYPYTSMYSTVVRRTQLFYFPYMRCQPCIALLLFLAAHYSTASCFRSGNIAYHFIHSHITSPFFDTSVGTVSMLSLLQQTQASNTANTPGPVVQNLVCSSSLSV